MIGDAREGGHDTAVPDVGSDAFFRAIVDTAANPYVLIDRDFILRYASPSIEMLLGWRPADWIGRSVSELLVPDSLELAASGLGEIEMASRDPNWVGAPVRVFLHAADGSRVPVDAYARSTLRTGVPGTLVQLTRAGASQTMGEAIDTILEGEDLDHALRLLTSLTEFAITDTEVMLGSGWNGSGFAKVAGHDRLLFLNALDPTDRDAISTVLDSGHRVADVFPGFARGTRSAAEARGWRACWCAPIPADDSPTAALFIWRREPGPPGVIFRDDLHRSVNLVRLALRWMGTQQLLAWSATHDPLTKLTNRSEFQNQLDLSAGRARAVLYCDLDDFKPVNEALGHHVGDRVLAAVAERLRGVCTDCIVARLGGDEFAVLMAGVESLDTALRVAQQIQATLTDPISVDARQIDVGVTVGVAFDPSGAIDSDHLLARADHLLLAGKSEGKNRILSTVVDGVT